MFITKESTVTHLDSYAISRYQQAVLEHCHLSSIIAFISLIRGRMAAAKALSSHGLLTPLKLHQHTPGGTAIIEIEESQAAFNKCIDSEMTLLEEKFFQQISNSFRSTQDGKFMHQSWSVPSSLLEATHLTEAEEINRKIDILGSFSRCIRSHGGQSSDISSNPNVLFSIDESIVKGKTTGLFMRALTAGEAGIGRRSQPLWKAWREAWYEFLEQIVVICKQASDGPSGMTSLQKVYSRQEWKLLAAKPSPWTHLLLGYAEQAWTKLLRSSSLLNQAASNKGAYRALHDLIIWISEHLSAIDGLGHKDIFSVGHARKLRSNAQARRSEALAALVKTREVFQTQNQHQEETEHSTVRVSRRQLCHSEYRLLPRYLRLVAQNLGYDLTRWDPLVLDILDHHTLGRLLNFKERPAERYLQELRILEKHLDFLHTKTPKPWHLLEIYQNGLQQHRSLGLKCLHDIFYVLQGYVLSDGRSHEEREAAIELRLQTLARPFVGIAAKFFDPELGITLPPATYTCLHLQERSNGQKGPGEEDDATVLNSSIFNSVEAEYERTNKQPLEYTRTLTQADFFRDRDGFLQVSDDDCDYEICSSADEDTLRAPHPSARKAAAKGKSTYGNERFSRSELPTLAHTPRKRRHRSLSHSDSDL